MTDMIQNIAAAMRADAESLRIVAQNIANADTPAYRRQIAVHHSGFDSTVAQMGSPERGDEATGVTVEHDHKPGSLKHTGEPLHLALDGPGFFVLQTRTGLALTRRGDFHRAADGTLVTAADDVVMGDDGPMQLDAGSVSIASDGSVSIDGSIADRIRIVQIEDGAQLAARGDGTFSTDPSALRGGDLGASVRQGFLESSNVGAVTEMVQLMETVRHFEFEQRFARAYDGLMSDAIRDLGKTG